MLTLLAGVLLHSLNNWFAANRSLNVILHVRMKMPNIYLVWTRTKEMDFISFRSVITPDPYLDIDEIGIPEVFAKKLTFTEYVNAINVQHLRKLVENGPKMHPGSVFDYVVR